MPDDTSKLQEGFSGVPDDFDPDDPEAYSDVDKMMEDATGNIPEAGKPFSLADEVNGDEADR